MIPEFSRGAQMILRSSGLEVLWTPRSRDCNVMSSGDAILGNYLLTLDVGNTNTVVGLFKESQVSFRISVAIS